MAKVSIGLRGWRFDESAVFDDAGNFRSVEDMPADTRKRLVRLVALYDAPCDACWLIHGDEALERCNVSSVVYGEPMAEVTLCDAHEADFLYWFRECGGAEYRGSAAVQDEFHEWFAAGNRAPEGYGGLEHVETDPDAVPDPHVPDQSAVTVPIPEEERHTVDLHDPDRLRAVFGEERAAELLERIRAQGGGAPPGATDDSGDAPGGELDLDGLDLDADYST
ncbi:MAG: hypothetical protein ABEJ42_04685 [Halobacteriaceae archaeon]